MGIPRAAGQTPGITLVVSIACRACRGQGFTQRGRHDAEGRYFVLEENCDRCEGAGNTVERVTFSPAALLELRAALFSFEAAHGGMGAPAPTSRPLAPRTFTEEDLRAGVRDWERRRAREEGHDDD